MCGEDLNAVVQRGRNSDFQHLEFVRRSLTYLMTGNDSAVCSCSDAISPAW